MGQEHVHERVFLTSDKRAAVPESDKRARFLLATPGPVDPPKAKEIRSFRHGANFLHKKARQPGGDTAGDPGEDKGGEPDADKGESAGDDKSKSPAGDKGNLAANFGPDDPVDFGKFAGTPVKDLATRYLQNLQRIDKHRAWAQVELARREAL